MNLTELKSRAQAKAAQLQRPGDLDGERDRLRGEVATYLDEAAEPPVYRRRTDPAHQQVLGQLAEGELLLARIIAFENERLVAWRHALEAVLQAHCLISEGRLEEAEDAWLVALELERKAAKERRVWSRSDERPLAVYDRDTGDSRFDARPEPSMHGKLLCPHCRAVGEHAFSVRHATHHFVCRQCQMPFDAYVGELRSFEVKDGPAAKRYRLRLDELSGERTRVDFDDASGATFTAVRRDLIALLYAPRPMLKGVMNLSSGRALWLKAPGACFIASAVYGEHAVQLHAFRRFRDEVLMHSRAGQAAVWGYYAVGPRAARVVRRVPLLRLITKAVLDAVHGALQQ